MAEFNNVVAHFEGGSWPGNIVALEGRGGYMRVALERVADQAPPAVGAECDLEMHDGARFHVVVTEELPPSEQGLEVRMKLLGRSRA